MLDELNFVKGAVSTKELVPVLTNFSFANGRVQGTNGKISMDAPCDLDASVSIPAARFIDAINACRQEPTLRLTEKSLIIEAGALKVRLPLSCEEFPRVKPEGQYFPGGSIRGALQAVREFIGTDAARPWACGVLFQDGYCYATNNVTLVRMPVAWDAPAINLPSFAVDELLRVGLDITQVQVAENSITFHFGDRWLRSQLFDLAWPDIANFFTDAELPMVPEGFAEAVDTVLPFCPDQNLRAVHTSAAGVSTDDGAMSAVVEGIELPEGRYRAEPLILVLSRADRIDLTPYPRPCPFAAPGGLQGVLLGLKT
jgi:DNA polymerase III sliding clamp (beta) subunit (PCNA family)